MGQPFPIPRQTRASDPFYGDGGAAYGPFDFKIFDIEDVTVYVRTLTSTEFLPVSAVVAKVSDAPFDDFTGSLVTAIELTTQFIVVSKRIAERSAGITKGTMIDPAALEKEQSKQASTQQELRRDLDRAIKVAFDADHQSAPVPEDGKVLGWFSGRLVNLLLAPMGSSVSARKACSLLPRRR